MQNFLSLISEPFYFYIPYLGALNIMPIAVSLALFLGLIFTFRFIRFVLVVRLKSFSKNTDTTIDDVLVDVLENISPIVYSYVALYIALLQFDINGTAAFTLKLFLLLALLWQGISSVQKFVSYSISRWVEVDEDGDGEVDSSSATASDLLRLISGVILWALGSLLVLSNLGIEVTSLLAGLGIGGIAVAFALQGVLSDLFASFSIYFDKPFRIGDFVVLGTDSGTVEKIGIKSTRIRTLQGEELVVSNAELTTARVQNFKKMERRRIITTFGVVYETPVEQLEALPDVVREIFTTLERARLDRVFFTTLGDSALVFEVVYFVDSSEYQVYLGIQQAFNLALLRECNERGISFAYPTQTVYHKPMD